jgi:hypothetical protein
MTLPNLAALIAASLSILAAPATAINTPTPTPTPTSTPTPSPSAYTTSTIVYIHFPYGRYSSSQDLHASIITVLAVSDFTNTWTNTIYTYHNSYNKSAAPATSYWVACPPSIPATDCEYGHGVRVLDGPKTLEFHKVDTPGVAVTCNVGYDDERPEYDATAMARCRSVSSGDPSKTKDIGPVMDIRQWLGRVTVTEGLEKLGGASAGGGASGVVSTASAGGGSAATTTTTAGGGVVGTTTTGIVSESTSGSAVSTGSGKVETSTNTAPASPGTTAPTVSSSKTSSAGMAVVTGNLRAVAAVAAVFWGILVCVSVL